MSWRWPLRYMAGHNNQDQGGDVWARHSHERALVARTGIPAWLPGAFERIGRWTGPWPADIGDLKKKWEGAVNGVTSALTVAAQQKPENQWEVHPALDGCRPRNKTRINAGRAHQPEG